ncbi:flagellar filament capping protein FliD [Nocardioides humi]|uniref:Flagellar hook-associated protein 2 n=1 Tax=Nocardioides humi TaxID=449461 RepID=A0ABN2AWA7_9ACTN|nr:flagellar filament capping protein FliD [Nocardioides humi]
MAGTSSIGGLASGLDTATIVNQLMTLEAVSQTKLKSQVTTEQGKVTALQKLNTALQSLATAAKAMAVPATSTWSSLTATSSNTGVSIAATSAATPGAFTVTVGQTALTHQLAYADAHSRSDVVTGATSSVVLKRAGEPDLQIDTANGTLEELAAAINGADAGVRATLVRTGSAGGTDQYRLLVESSATGAAQAFELTDSSGAALLGDATVRAGRDASIDIGGITATSASNTFADVVPGVTITLGAAATGSADVTVARDAEAQSAAVKGFVDQLNAVLTQISTLTANGAEAKGTLAGDSTLRRVAGALQDAVFPPEGTSMARFGIQVDRYGKVTFDAEVFASSYAADPVATAAAFTGADGFAARVQKVADAASDKYDGTVTNAITSHTSTITRLNASIAAWDDRLELRRATLERQYTALETALSQLNSQSSWLTSQLEALANSTSS